MSVGRVDEPASVRGSGGEPGAGVRVRDLARAYRTRGRSLVVFEQLSFDVTAGAFVAIVGPSGCGKSTLLLCLAGLLPPTSGTIHVGSEPIIQPSPEKIGLIYQEPNLLPWRTVIENVAFPLEIRGVRKAERLARAQGFLEMVRLADFAQVYPHELSGGMRQRVAIARGLVQDPDLLLMDEPFAALDEQSRLKLGTEVLRIWEQTRKTVLFVTHNLTEAVFLSDEVLVLGQRPATVLDRVRIDLPRPRRYHMMATEQFGGLRDRIWRQIMELGDDEDLPGDLA